MKGDGFWKRIFNDWLTGIWGTGIIVLTTGWITSNLWVGVFGAIIQTYVMGHSGGRVEIKKKLAKDFQELTNLNAQLKDMIEQMEAIKEREEKKMKEEGKKNG